MDELEYFSKEDKIEYGILVFTIHNITQDALLWNELHNNMICEFDGIKFTKEPPKELGELYLTQDNMIYIEYNAKYTSKSLFGFYIESVVNDTFHNCSLDIVKYDSKTKIDITICVHGEILNFTINFKRGDIPWKLPVDNPEYLKF